MFVILFVTLINNLTEITVSLNKENISGQVTFINIISNVINLKTTLGLIKVFTAAHLLRENL